MKAKTNVRELTISMVIPLLIFLVSSAAISRIFAYQIWQRTNVEANYILSYAIKSRQEIHNSLNNLNDLRFNECNEQNLLEMRKVLFRSHFIKDIGFFNGKDLICTTGLGLLKVPFTDTVEPDVVSPVGIEYWHFEKLLFFNQEHSGLIARLGNYNVVIDPEFMTDLLGQEYRWEMFFSYEGNEYSWAGEAGISNHASRDEPYRFWEGRSSTVVKCDASGRLCAAVEPNKIREAEFPPLLVELTFLFSISLGGFGYLWVRKYYLRKRTTANRVKQALINGDFYCVYQPIVDLHTGEVVGVEMLARVEDEYGCMTPDEFIPVISQQEKTWEFSARLMKIALTELNPVVTDDFRLSMNVFPKDIASGEVARISSFGEFKHFKGSVILEVTESEYLEEEGSPVTIAHLQTEGIDIAIDDFGTGYSNLNQLRKINSQVLKIDRSFVIDVEDGAIRSSLIQHIVDIARGEKMKLVAEGIETTVQHQALKKMGIEYGQGWAFGKPMKISDLADYLALADEGVIVGAVSNE